MEPPPISNLEEEKLFEYISDLSPLKTNKCGTTQTLNSLGMDYSLLTSPDASIYEDKTVLKRNLNSILNTSKPEVSPESTTFSPDNVTMTAKIGDSGNSSGKTASCFQTGQTSHSANRTSESVRIDQMTSEAMPSTSLPTDTDIKSCKCKGSDCFSGYCECFSTGSKCTETCKCRQECNNIHGRKDSTAETKSGLEETET